jgi:hypothetical protein
LALALSGQTGSAVPFSIVTTRLREASMSASSGTIALKANSPLANSGSGPNKTGSVQTLIIEHVKAIFGVKPWGPLAEYLGIEDRTAQHRVYGTRAFDCDETAKLLWREDGWHLFVAIMEAAPRKPLWWKICRPLMRTAEMERAQLIQRRELQALLTEALGNDAKLAADIQAGRAAIARQDADFVEPHAEAVLSTTRPMGRSVAGKGRR